MLTSGQLRARLEEEGPAPSSWGNEARHHYAAHRHEYDKVLVAVQGSIVFHLPELDRDISLDAGDRLDLPAGTLHGADVGERGVTCLEAHLAAGVLGPEPNVVPGWGATDS